MKILTIIFAVLIFSFSVISQDFKEVKTAMDVVDNYILASGGEDELRSVESLSMKGKMGEGEESGTIVIYFSKKYVYMNITTSQFALKQAIDIESKKGWTKFGTILKDLNEEEINKNRQNVEGSLWSNFLDPKANNIKFELLQNEKVDGKDCYVIDLIRDSTTYSTSYFDFRTFNKVKEIKGSMTNEFTDFRKVGSTGIIMPYSIKSQNGNVVMTEIKFNSKFDKKLLEKPE